MSLTQTVACLVGHQLDEAVGQEILSDVKPGDGYGNQGGCFGGTLCEPRRR